MPSSKRDGQRHEQSSTDRQRSSQDDAFVKHLEHASSVVRTWPAWKQEILGGTSSPPQVDCSSKKA